MSIEDKDLIRRLHMKMPKEIHQRLRLMAIKYNCTITKYVMRIIYEQLQKEKHYDGE